jgi:tetratricopeptide (TPR) repeat protein
VGNSKDSTAAIKVDPKSALAYYIRGNAFYSKKEYDKSIADFSEAIELEPMNAKAYCNRGLSRNARKDYDRAIEDFNEAISFFESKQRASTISRRQPWYPANEYTQAITDFNEDDRPFDRYPDALTGRAIAWQNKGKYDKATDDFSKTVDRKLGLGTPSSCGSFAWLLATCPDPKYRDGKQAVQLALLANRMNRGNAAGALDVLAAAYAESGKFEEAINYEKQSIEATDKEEKDNLEQRRARLKLFEQKKPYREP